jgi:hypothetical protein
MRRSTDDDQRDVTAASTVEWCSLWRAAVAEQRRGVMEPLAYRPFRALRFRLVLERLQVERQKTGMDEVEASGGARSEALQLLHRCTGSSDGLTAPIHATRHSGMGRPD